MDTAVHTPLEDRKQGGHGVQLEAIRKAYIEIVTIFLPFEGAFLYPKKLGTVTDKLTRKLCGTGQTATVGFLTFSLPTSCVFWSSSQLCVQNGGTSKLRASGMSDIVTICIDFYLYGS